MEYHDSVCCKVLVAEDDPLKRELIFNFCAAQRLIPVTVDNIVDMLRESHDIGGVFLGQSAGSSVDQYLELAKNIRQIQYCIPIFFRTDNHNCHNEWQQDFSLIYQIDNTLELEEFIKSNIFSYDYPARMLHDMEAMTKDALSSCLNGAKVNCSSPYMVIDGRIPSELFGIISLETEWCRGHMMLQAERQNTLRWIEMGHTIQACDDLSKYNLDSFLSEVINMIWGAFRYYYESEAARTVDLTCRPQIPLIIEYANHRAFYGVENYELCFRYTVESDNNDLPELSFLQKLNFNLAFDLAKYQDPPMEYSSDDSGSIDEF